MPVRSLIRRALVLAALGTVAAACGGDDASLSPEASEGRQIANSSGCAGCHGTRGEGGVGPAWTDLYGSQVELDDGTTVTADDDYLYRSITDPGAQITADFNVRMPANALSDEQIAKVISYIRELGQPAVAPGSLPGS
jgi:cytochrome c oxidase subunit 2